MRTAVLPFVLVLAVIGCTSHEGRVESNPEPTPTPTPTATPKPTPQTPDAPKIALRGAIASVSLIQNCPDDASHQPPAPVSDKVEAMEPPADEAVPAAAQRIAPGSSAFPGGGGPSFHQPCTQSFMQLTLGHDGRDAQKIEIAAVRLTAAGTGAKLGPVPFRAPTRWDEAGRYVAWDQSIPAGQELKASYKLGELDWYAIGKAIGNDDTYAPRYVLEVDVVFDGRTITLRSHEFQREHAHVIVT